MRLHSSFLPCIFKRVRKGSVGMIKRLLDCTKKDIMNMKPFELKQSIYSAEGRTIIAEIVAPTQPLFGSVTNAEVVTGFGADLLLLNSLDCFAPFINGVPHTDKNPITWIKEATGRPIGVNLEPVDTEMKPMSTIDTIGKGRLATEETFHVANELGIDFILLTGNPKTNVTNKKISETIKIAKGIYKGLIFAGKMHSAGVDEPVITKNDVDSYVEAGADVILIPAPYTVPGFTPKIVEDLVNYIKMINTNKEIAQKVLTLSANGTSQDSSDLDTIREMARISKGIGFDMQHIGDSIGGLPDPEAIYALGKTIRGKRHQVTMMTRSLIR